MEGYQEVNGNQVAVLLAGIGWFGFNLCHQRGTSPKSRVPIIYIYKRLKPRAF